MKKNIIKNILTAFAVAVMVVGFNGTKAEAKNVDWSEYDRSTCVCSTEGDKISRAMYCKSQRHYLDCSQVSKIDATIDMVKPIISAAPEAPHEAVKHFHDELCKRTSYSLDYSKYDLIDPYEVLSSGKAKCVGYSETFKLLCDIAGIPCRIVDGYGNSIPHEWNMVQLEDGQWYEVDCTFDDSESGDISYNWFLLTTKEMNKDHKRDSEQIGGNPPIAKGTKYATFRGPVITCSYYKDGQVKVKWKKPNKKNDVKGYEIEYSTDSKFKKRVKKITIKKPNATSQIVRKIKYNKRYYMRVRSFKRVHGKKVYSEWSSPIDYMHVKHYSNR